MYERATLEQTIGDVVELDSIDVVDSVPSTNAALAEATPPPPGHWQALIAREQTGGRGRGGNNWHSPKDAGLWMSLLRRLAPGETVNGSMTLAMGVGVAQGLVELGIDNIQLKWPNDLVVEGRKLGGMLTEVRRDVAVCGIGINMLPVDESVLDSDRALPPTDLDSLPGLSPAPTLLAATVIRSAIEAVDLYAAEGLAPFREAWREFDYLAGKQVRIADIKPEILGRAVGIGEDGSLIVEHGKATFTVVAGTVRLADQQ